MEKFTRKLAEEILDQYPSSIDRTKKLSKEELQILSLINCIRVHKKSHVFYSKNNSSRIRKSTLDIVSKKIKQYQEEVDNYFNPQQKWETNSKA